VRVLADEVGLSTAELITRVAALAPPVRARVRLGRALALGPRLVLAEHPTASLERDAATRFAADLSRIVEHRRIAALVLTADREIAHRMTQRVLALNPATGELKRRPRWSVFS
jgi:ABC-type phosphate/phosphonate transport system ATPase subunit